MLFIHICIKKLEWDIIVLIYVGLQQIFGDKWKKLKLISLNNILKLIVVIIEDDDYNSTLPFIL